MARGKTGGNKRAAMRGERRSSGRGLNIFFGTMGIGANTVRSINLILKQHNRKKLTGRSKKVVKKWLEYRKKIEALMKEGYVFDGVFLDVYNGDIKNSEKMLEWFSKFDKRELRKHAKSYKGERDVNKMWQMYLDEQKRKKQQSAKAAADRRRIQEMIDALDKEDQVPEEEIPEARDIRIENILEEQRKYLIEVYEYPTHGVDPETRQTAIDLAQKIIYGAKTLSPEEKDAVIEFWEGETLYEAMATESTQYRRLFYAGILYNSGFLTCFNLDKGEFEKFKQEYDIVPGYAPGSGVQLMSINNAEEIVEDFF